MKNYVYEQQDGAVLTQAFSDEQVATGAADQDFFTRCIYARVSKVEHHTILLVDETGRVLRREHFYHERS